MHHASSLLIGYSIAHKLGTLYLIVGYCARLHYPISSSSELSLNSQRSAQNISIRVTSSTCVDILMACPSLRIGVLQKRRLLWLKMRQGGGYRFHWALPAPQLSKGCHLSHTAGLRTFRKRASVCVHSPALLLLLHTLSPRIARPIRLVPAGGGCDSPLNR